MVEEMLKQAVLGKHRVQFTYEGRTKVVEPHLVGHNMRGHLLLNAWFVRGDPKYNEEGWQDYMLVGMSNLIILPECFDKPRFGYNPMDDRKYANIQFCL